ncbi:MAG: hypothetical protein KDJ45_12675 [Hyphomicrobiaceae bacterium]|nr:hypothetical protein [Hyphomicrobiaceae bacterium]
MQMTATRIPDHVHPEQAHQFMKNDGLILIDVRTEGEWMRTGVAEGAVTLTASGPEFLDHVLDLTGGDKNRPVAFICASGARSAHVQRFMQANGFTQAVNVVEGMSGGSGPGWILRGLPTVSYHHRRS